MLARNDIGGTSTKNLVHWAQGVRTGEFRQFDLGSTAANEKAYGQKVPPKYDLNSFNHRLNDLPILLAVGKNDYLTELEDVRILEAALPDSAQFLYFNDWNHLDQMWGSDAAKRLYNSHIIPFIKDLK